MKGLKLKYYRCVLKYECECIKNTKLVESKENFIQSNNTTALTLLLTTVIKRIDKIVIVA